MSGVHDREDALVLRDVIRQLRVEADGETDEDTRARLEKARSTAIDKLQAALDRFE